jgi:SAM-dependent methyltransferase
MEKFDIEKIKEYYDNADEIWPKWDLWYTKTNQSIISFLLKTKWANDSYVLNAGSGGSTYGLPYNFHHVDISSNHMDGLNNFTKANIEQLPFKSNLFDNCICVGSVLNYCDALQGISELSRVVKPKGEIIIEFDNSWGYRHKGTDFYGIAAGVATFDFRNMDYTQWVYTEKYIESLCAQFGLKVIKKKRFHIINSLVLNKKKDENIASRYFWLDCLTKGLPFFSKHANNIIFRLIKC